jgi:hypothetical protein
MKPSGWDCPLGYSYVTVMAPHDPADDSPLVTLRLAI